jgi:hypothetical protein
MNVIDIPNVFSAYLMLKTIFLVGLYSNKKENPMQWAELTYCKRQHNKIFGKKQDNNLCPCGEIYLKQVLGF